MAQSSCASPCAQFLFSACDLMAGSLIARLVAQLGAPKRAVLVALAAWLFNPWTLAISTRGSCDVLGVLLLLSTLWCLLQGQAARAATAYGFAVHLRVRACGPAGTRCPPAASSPSPLLRCTPSSTRPASCYSWQPAPCSVLPSRTRPHRCSYGSASGVP
jgi:hypothetical protein